MRFLSRRTLAAGAAAAGISAVAAAASVWMVSVHVDDIASTRLYDDIASLPRREVALVLGTSPNARGGADNAFYEARIDAAAELFHSGKVGHIIVSGSNPSRYYNEPFVMKRDLVQRAIPAGSITEDQAGFRTFDSIVRADKVMGQRSFTVVTQRSHAARALYLAMHFDLDAVAYCAKDPTGAPTYTAQLRELGARFKALLDVNVLDTQPRFLGEPVEIRLRPSERQGPVGALD